MALDTINPILRRWYEDRKAKQGKQADPITAQPIEEPVPATMAAAATLPPEELASPPEPTVGTNAVPETDQELTDAQDSARLNRLVAGLSGAANKIGHAIAGVDAPDNKGFEALAKNADWRVKDLQAQREAKKDKEAGAWAEEQKGQQRKAWKDAGDEADPNSQTSINFRNAIQAFLPKEMRGQFKDFDKMSAKQGKDLLPKLYDIWSDAEARKQAAAASAAAAQDRLAQQKEMFDQRLAATNRNTNQREFRPYFSTYQSRIRALDQGLLAAQNVSEMVRSGNPIADSSIPIQLARLSGEKGALSDSDVRRFQGLPNIQSKLDRLRIKLLTKKGSLTPEDRKFMGDLADSLERNAQQYKKTIGKEVTRQLTARMEKLGDATPFAENYYLLTGNTYEDDSADAAPAATDGQVKTTTGRVNRIEDLP